MPIIVDWSRVHFDDGTVTIGIQPPVNLSGMGLRFNLMKRFEGISGIYQAFAGSGFNNVSGINVTDAIDSYFQVFVPGIVLSGLNPIPLAYNVVRTDSGFHTELDAGYVLMQPSQP
jgi:hypothetical protein